MELVGDRALAVVLDVAHTDGARSWPVTVVPAASPCVVALTRLPDDDHDVFGPLVAHSAHLAVHERGTEAACLGNRGVAFAPGVLVGPEVREARTVRRPHLLQTPGGWALIAERGLPDGARDGEAASSVLVWTSTDLLDWHYQALVRLPAEDAADPWAVWDGAAQRYWLCWTECDGRRLAVTTDSLTAPGLQHSVPGGWPGLVGARPAPTSQLGRAWSAVVVTFERAADLLAAPAPASALAFPWIAARADPCVLPFRDGVLFAATDDSGGDNVNSVGLPLRAARTLEELRAAPEHLVVTPSTGDLAGCFWAPELHEVGGRLHCLFAPSVGSADWTRVQCHVMTLRQGGDPLTPEDWSAPRPVLQADGSPLQLDEQHPGISLDMTYLEDGEAAYLVWSQRVIFPSLGDAQLWIARADKDRLDRLAGPPVRLLSPTLGWQMNGGAVVEGPAAVLHGDRVVLTYAAASVGARYCTGAMWARRGADLTDPDAWHHLDRPLLSSDASAGVWGPGHGTFTTGADGELLFVFHAMREPHALERDTAVARTSWHRNLPHVDLSSLGGAAPELTLRVSPTYSDQEGRR